MTAVTTTTDADLDLSVIEHLDFTPTLPCEHSRHEETHRDEPGKYLVVHLCHECDFTVKYVICESGWKRLEGRDDLHCHRGCGNNAAYVKMIAEI